MGPVLLLGATTEQGGAETAITQGPEKENHRARLLKLDLWINTSKTTCRQWETTSCSSFFKVVYISDVRRRATLRMVRKRTFSGLNVYISNLIYEFNNSFKKIKR